MVFVGMVNMMNEIIWNHIKYGQMVLALKSASEIVQWHISQMPTVSYTILQLAEAFEKPQHPVARPTLAPGLTAIGIIAQDGMAGRCQVHADLVPGKDRMAHGWPMQKPRKWSMKNDGWKFHIYVSLLENHQKTPGSFGKYENGGTHALLQLDSVWRLHLLMVLGPFIPRTCDLSLAPLAPAKLPGVSTCSRRCLQSSLPDMADPAGYNLKPAPCGLSKRLAPKPCIICILEYLRYLKKMCPQTPPQKKKSPGPWAIDPSATPSLWSLPPAPPTPRCARSVQARPAGDHRAGCRSHPRWLGDGPKPRPGRTCAPDRQGEWLLI